MTAAVPVVNRFPDSRAADREPYSIGLVAILTTVVMLFTAFTAALLIRRTGDDWARVALPGIVWANTLVILLSSAAIERARAAVRANASQRAAGWMSVGALFGLLFLAGQVIAWRSLAAHGVFLSSNPHAAFFYMLSGVHGAHVLGGLAALGWTLGRTRAGAYGPARHAGLTHAAVYWHTVGGVWLWLLAILSTL
ncbi:MAG TPA: cytochrome c oxidase subunit 3 [Gemmatimonadales bacterium]|nr:cytochrome c oxidase subunit 3 [Gemmatimonadales bacterium]